MKIIEGLESFLPGLSYPVLTIGNFDGVHLGHKRILSRTSEIARGNGGTAISMTFWPHPAQFFAPGKRLQYLTDNSTKCALMEQAGIEIALIVPFDREFSLIEAKDFVRKVIAETIQARELVVGFNFSFGRGKTGDSQFLDKEGKQLGFLTHVIGPFEVEGEVISSTKIRSLLREGDVEGAAKQLGREYGIKGKVVRGANRGAGIGFPTANLRPGDLLVPAKGVYVARGGIDGVIYPGVVNVGVNPTFGENTLAVELHLFDFKQDLYEKEIEVRFCRRIRPEQKFSSVDDLVAQIRRDVQEAKAHFQKADKGAD
jgi:riboflavin kinase/FMN adenylyltransferase